MWTDENSIKDLEKSVLLFGPDIISKCICRDPCLSKYIDMVAKEHLKYPIPKQNIDIDNWLIPEKYKNMDIEGYLMNKCPEQNQDRVTNELELYKKNSMIPLLRTMKYLVDTLRNNNVVWGVGRGSSVASYVLYLIGVHKIDSVKYNLPIEEFFKGE
jgi:DNA polymerase III alpha subunit